jgi:hypothetical protein
MKSPEETLDYIDRFTRSALDRPHMYASSPQALEEKLALLDMVRSFILEIPPRQGYPAYLRSKGYGVGQFLSRFIPNSGLSDKDKELFQALGSFWRQYLASRAEKDEETGDRS